PPPFFLRAARHPSPPSSRAHACRSLSSSLRTATRLLPASLRAAARPLPASLLAAVRSPPPPFLLPVRRRSSPLSSLCAAARRSLLGNSLSRPSATARPSASPPPSLSAQRLGHPVRRTGLRDPRIRRRVAGTWVAAQQPETPWAEETKGAAAVGGKEPKIPARRWRDLLRLRKQQASSGSGSTAASASSEPRPLRRLLHRGPKPPELETPLSLPLLREAGPVAVGRRVGERAGGVMPGRLGE
ncbi:uncharacterized protein LOC112873784, partial [Panicum hallii]|uniref:uncharacterized protein LOC112873784 n=1 Tax=Panicum hallii TaxID=206008 RepID=UPI000DF4D4C8